ncbi:MAG: hypothetical protein SVG88_13360 [Halobacteriales archaeon]|nr:hypothetical protein [Halobacteriales archaeon]
MTTVPARVIAVTVLTITLLLAATTGGYTGSATAAGSASGFLTQTDVDPDAVSLQVLLQPDGSAAWRIEYRVLLKDDNATAAFDSLQTDIRENRSAYVDRFASRITRTAAAAENTTGREMAIRNVSVQTSRQTIGKRYGVITYTFEWTGFAAVDGDRLVVDRTLAGFFLDADTTLEMRWPPGYRVSAVSPSPTDRLERGVVWEGRLDFGQSGPQLTVTTAPPTQTATESPSPGAATSGGLTPATLGVAAIIALLIVGAGGWYYTQRSTESDDADTTGGATGETATTESTDQSTEEPPSELLSNEEQVIRLLEANGGRMKQQDVAEELDWTDAKTSQVVSDLREAGDIESFRLGRENVLSLPEEDDI